MSRHYSFELGLNDNYYDEYKKLLFRKLQTMTDEKTVGYSIAHGKAELTDDIIFEEALSNGIEYLKQELAEVLEQDEDEAEMKRAEDMDFFFGRYFADKDYG
jgi:hypothetical protein